MTSQGASEFGELLRRQRRAAGLTQEALAELAGISSRAITDLERGIIRAPRRDTLEMLADALGLPDEERQQWRQLRTRLSSRNRSTDRWNPSHVYLPQPPNQLIGRDADISALADLLSQPNVRMVTVTGPGGVGKTRVSIAVGRHISGEFDDGVRFIELAAIQEPELLISVFAQELGLRETNDHAVRERLTTFLAHRRLLLILDNFEQLLPAANEIATLLATSSKLKVLVTSRARLGLQAEHEFPLLPLRLPEWDADPSKQEMTLFPAIELFVQRSQQMDPNFSLTAENAAAITAICSHLDGLPLAIELAAARVKVLSPREMLPRLVNRLAFLTGGLQDVPDRHRTMHGAIAWSYDLLTLRQKQLFRQLSIFVDGWSLEAAESVSSHGTDVVEDLSALVNSSLIYRTEMPSGRNRFGMLETIREFALLQLAELNELERARRAHAEYFLEFAEEAESGLRTREQGHWLDRVVLERANLHSAGEWSQRDDVEPEFSLRLSGALHFGLSHVIPVDIEPELGLRLRRGLDWKHETQQGGGPHDPELLSQAYRHTTKDPRIRQKALAGAGWLESTRGDIATALTLLEESLRLARELDDQPMVAWTLHLLARTTTFDADTTSAPSYYQESIRVAETIGDDWIAAWGHHWLGLFHHAIRGEFSTAERHYKRSLTIRKKLGYREGIGVIWFLLGVLRYRQGDYPAALGLFHNSLETLRDLQALWVAVGAIANCVPLAVIFGEPHRGARLGGFTRATKKALGRSSLPFSDTTLQQGLDSARHELSNNAFEVAFTEGASLSLEEAIDEALAIDGSKESQGLSVRPSRESVGYPDEIDASQTK